MKRNMTKLAAAGLAAALLAMPVHAAGMLEPVCPDADFSAPAGVVLRADGTLLVADSGRNQILAVGETAAEVVAGYAMPEYIGGHLDGSAPYALFDEPFAVVEWNGVLAVSDRGNHVLRQISGGKVKTLAGSGERGTRDGIGAEVQFDSPAGLAVDDAGALYIADSGSGCIRKLTTDGRVTTWLRGLSQPTGLCWQGGALYIADAGAHCIWRAVNGTAVRFAGREVLEDGVSVGGFRDGSADTAEFCAPMGVCADGDTLYVADTGNSAIRRIRGGVVSTLAAYDGRSEEIWPAEPTGVAMHGGKLCIADRFAARVLRLDPEKMLYTDVPASQWYADAVSFAYTEGLMNGVGGGAFRPNGTLTRAEVVTMLYRMAGSPEVTAQPSFPDVSAGMWYTDAIAWAVQNGIVDGYPDGRFLPNGTITREQMAKLLCALASQEDSAAEPLRFPDAGQVSAWAERAMRWAVAQKLFGGYADGTLRPGSGMTRAEGAALLMRAQTQIFEN